MIEWVLAGLFGALFGAGELIPRYRDAPMWILGTPSAWGYLAINAGASLAAFGLIRAFDLNFALANGNTKDFVQVLVAGFGAMGLFRSSIFVARIGEEDVPVGPVTLLQAGLDAADRGVDRKRAEVRAKEIRQAMQGVSFEEAVIQLPQLAFNLMQNVTSVEKAKLAEAAADLSESDFDEQTKVYVLGLALLTLTGKGTLNSAVELLGSQAANPAPAPA